MQTKSIIPRIAAFLLACASFSEPMWAADLVWTNTLGGNWGNAANWHPNQVPDPLDAVWITNSGSYTVSVNANATVSSLMIGGAQGTQSLNLAAGVFTLNGVGIGNSHALVGLAGGTFSGTGVLILEGPLDWTDGLITGNVQCNGGSISGTAVKELRGGRLVNMGVMGFSHNPAYGAPFYTGSGSVISNAPGGIFEILSDAGTSFNNVGPRGIINNSGIWRKTAGTGLSTLNDTFNNTGTVEAGSGVLALANGGNNSGTNSAMGGGRLDFAGGTHSIEAGSRIVGDGTVGSSGGTVNLSGTCNLPGTMLVNGGTMNFNSGTVASVGTLTVRDGILGGSGWVAVSGGLGWTGGAITGNVQCNGGSISGTAVKELRGGRLVNMGVMGFSHNPAYGAPFYTGSGSVISNAPGGIFEILSDAGTSFNNVGPRGIINNSGIWRKTAGTGLSTLNDTFNNTGTVEAGSGVLALANGGSNSGTNSAMGGGRLDFSGGTHNIEAGSRIVGDGTVGSSGGTVNLSGTCNLPGTMLVNGGTMNFNSGTVASVGTLTVRDGILGGSGWVAVSGGLGWTGGAITGNVQCNGGSISGTAVKELRGGRLVNMGVMGFSHNPAYGAPFYTGSGSVISNAPGGIFEILSDAGTSFNNVGPRGIINNSGIWRKTAGTGLSTLNDTFNNTGTVEAGSGVLALANGGSNSGTNSAMGGGRLDFAGGTHTLEDGSWVVGDGTVGSSGGTVNLSGTCNLPGTMLVNGGTMNFNSGTVASVGTLTVRDGILGGSGWVAVSGGLGWTGGAITGNVQCNGGSISGTAVKELRGARLVNMGVMGFSHNPAYGAPFYTGSGSVISNAPGGIFEILSDAGTSFNNVGPRGIINNSGIWRKTAGTGLSTLNDTFNNTGTVEAGSGVLALANGGSNSGTNSAMGGGRLDFSGGTHSLEPGSWIVGDGTVGSSGGTVNLSGTCNLPGTMLVNGGTMNFNSGTVASVGTLTVRDGILGGSGWVTVSGGMGWTGGAITGNVQCNGGSISGTAVKELRGGRLVNMGVMGFSHNPAYGAPFYTGSGSVISNAPGGIFEILSDAGTSFNNVGPRGTINNSGIWRKTGGTGLSTLNDTFNNTGTVEAGSGVLALANGGNNSGTNSAMGGGRLDFSGGTHTLEDGSWVVGDGTVGSSGGTVNLSGTCNLPGTMLVNGGTMNFNSGTVASVGTLTVTDGILGGSGWVTVSSGMGWTGGAITGNVQCNGGSISGTAVKELRGGRLVNMGVMGFSHNPAYGAPFYTGSGSVISNAPGGIFEILSDAGTFFNNVGPRGTINNAGIWRKTGGTGLSTLNDTFNNTGTVEAGSGIFDFTMPLIQTAGATWLLGGVLQVRQGLLLEGGMLAGTNTVVGDVSNHATVSPGVLPGVLTVLGNYTENGNAHLQIDLGGAVSGTGYDRLSVSGIATLAGTLEVSRWNGFTPEAGTIFTVLVCGARSGSFSGMTSSNSTLTVFYSPTSVMVEQGNAEPQIQFAVRSDWIVGHTFQLQASATDLDGTITNLSLLMGTNLIGSFASGARRSITFGVDFSGEVTFTAEATDNRGAISSKIITGTITTRPPGVLDPVGFQPDRAFKLCMLGETGAGYQMLAIDNLTATNWVTLGIMQNVNGIWIYYDTTATNSMHRFYRVQRVP